MKSPPFHALLDFLDDFCGGHKVQNAERSHLVTHIVALRAKILGLGNVNASIAANFSTLLPSWATCKYSLQVESLSNSPSLYMFLRRIVDIAFLFFTLNQQLPSVNILKDRHLLNSYFVQFFQAFRLREVVVYKNGIQVFHIRKAN